MKKKIIILIIAGVLLVLTTGCILYLNLEQDYSHLDIEDYLEYFHSYHDVGKNSDWLPTRAQALRVTPGMSQEERIKIIGLPQEFKGSGVITDVYHLRDGGKMSIQIDGTISFSTSVSKASQLKKYNDRVMTTSFSARDSLLKWIATGEVKAPDHYYDDYNKQLVEPYEQAYTYTLNRIRSNGSVLLAEPSQEHQPETFMFSPYEEIGDDCITIKWKDDNYTKYSVKTFTANEAIGERVTDYLKNRYDVVEINNNNIIKDNGKEYYYLFNEDLIFGKNYIMYTNTVYFKVDDNHYCAVATNASKDKLMEVVNGLTFNKYDLE